WTLPLTEPMLDQPTRRATMKTRHTATKAPINWRRTDEIRNDTGFRSFRGALDVQLIGYRYDNLEGDGTMWPLGGLGGDGRHWVPAGDLNARIRLERHVERGGRTADHPKYGTVEFELGRADHDGPASVGQLDLDADGKRRHAAGEHVAD